MGLLDKALTLDQQENKFSPDIDSMIASLNSSAMGIEFPTTLFSHIVKELEISKGALLLPEKNSLFVPWAETGFDKTTSRRIRIEESLLENANDEGFYKIRELKDREIESIRDFFSFREFSVTDSVTLAPIVSQNQILALLFISEGKINNLDFEKKTEIFKKISSQAGPLLFNRREIILNKMEIVSTEKKDFNSLIAERISREESCEFIIINADMSSIVGVIKEQNENSLSFRIMEDILRLVNTLIIGRGDVCLSGSESIGILLGSERIEEAELIVHQVKISLGFFFKAETANIELPFKAKKYPVDGSTAESLVSDLV